MKKGTEHWEPEKIKFLKKFYSFLPMNELVEELDRTEAAIRGQAFLLGLRRHPAGLRNIILGKNDFRDVRERGE